MFCTLNPLSSFRFVSKMLILQFAACVLPAIACQPPYHMKKLWLICLLLTVLPALAQEPLPLIPQPTEVTMGKGIHVSAYHAVTFLDIPDASTLAFFNKRYKASQHLPSKLTLRYKQGMPEGAYVMRIEAKHLTLEAGTPSGFFYGNRTLEQLTRHYDGKIPVMTISDAPRFAWRGMHLDVSRHFFSVGEVKRYIDLLALYKMNVFHWHLTDDQGWRIEIKKYPQLTAVGGFRAQTVIGKAGSGQYDGQRYGGFYTQAQIKEVVAYAAERYITVVPEIEMPGHSLAALSAYPQFACTTGPFASATDWGVFDDVYCAGKDETFGFLTDILDEVIALFPGQHIHIGGDECPKTRWNACAACQKRMQTEGLKDAHELQSYFIQRIEKHVNAKGRKIIGWDEILEGGLAPNAAVMSWRGTEGGIAAAKAKHFAVMSPGNPCYFDHYQTKDQAGEPLAICCYNPLEAVYAYEPVPAELNGSESKYILGAQGNVWTEYMPNFNQVTYMALPRMAALAEVLWSPAASRNLPDFQRRLRLHLPELDKLGYKYAPHGY